LIQSCLRGRADPPLISAAALVPSAGENLNESTTGEEPMTTPKIALLSRRRFLKTAGASTAISTLGGIARPYLSRAADRPLITHGIQSGDVSIDSGVVWARADKPSRMQVEVATTDSFKDIRHAAFVDALPETDFTAKVL